MLIQISVFHSPNCPGNLKETNLFTRSRKCAVIKHHHCGLTSVPKAEGRGEEGGGTWGVTGQGTGGCSHWHGDRQTGGGSKTLLHFKGGTPTAESIQSR